MRRRVLRAALISMAAAWAHAQPAPEGPLDEVKLIAETAYLALKRHAPRAGN